MKRKQPVRNRSGQPRRSTLELLTGLDYRRLRLETLEARVVLDANNLAAYWKFDQAQSLGLDSSDQLNHLTAFGGAAYSAAGRSGGSLALDGIDDVLAINFGGVPNENAVPAGFPLASDPYTISVWVKPTTDGSRGMIGWGDYGTTRQVNAFRLGTGNQVINYWWGDDSARTSPVNLRDGNWHHVLTTYDGSLRTIYIDGANMGSDTPGPHTVTAKNFRVGRTVNPEFFAGGMDELAVWKSALAPNQISALAGGAAADALPIAGQVTLAGQWTADSLNASIADGAAIASWVDSVHTAAAVSVGTPRLQTNQLRGHSVVRFDPTDGNDQLRVPAASSPMSAATDFSVAVVFRTSAAAAGPGSNWYENTGLVDAELPGAANDWGLGLRSTGEIAAGLGNPDRTLYGAARPGLNDGLPHVAVYTRSAGVMTLHIDGQSVGQLTGVSATARAISDMTFGSLQTNANYFKGDIAEIRVYNGALTTTAAAALASDLATTYGVDFAAYPTPAAYWAFDDSVNLGKDSSVLNNTLKAFGDSVTYNAGGRFGGALSLGGSADYLALASGATEITNAVPAGFPLGNSSYTISAWIKPSLMGDRGIIGWGNYGNSLQVNALRLQGDNGFRHYWWGADLDATDAQVAAPPISADLDGGAWHHIVATYNGASRSLFLDGQLLVTDAPGANSATAQQFRLGNTNGGENFQGLMDDVAVWSTALTTEQIQALAAGTRKPYDPNLPPQPNNDTYQATEDTLLSVAANVGVLLNDTDPELGALTAIVLTGPSHGTLSLAANGSFTYQPDANFFGVDSFTYKASDGNNFGVATVTLNVANQYDAASGAGDNYVVERGAQATISAAAGVLANDLNPDQVALTVQLSQNVSAGTLSLASNGSFTYDPSEFVGTTTFQYRVNDGITLSPPVTVTLLVNGSPTGVSDSFSTAEDTPLVVNAAGGLLANDSDPEADALTAVLVTGPSNGILTLAADGSFTYTPAANYSGPDSFVYRASDGDQQSAAITVSLSVQPQNDPPVGRPDNYILFAGQTLNVAVNAGVLANDSDTDSPSFTAVIESPPAVGVLNLAANGSFSYQPAAAFTGLVTFTYRATDNAGAMSSPTMVTLDVRPIEQQVVINEINYEPEDNSVFAEFIELYNFGTSIINLSGWKFDAGVTYTFPAGTTINPGQYLLIAENPGVILSKYGLQALGPWVGGLSNEGEKLTLRNASGAKVDEVEYGKGFPWPLAAAGQGPSMELINPALDNDLGGSWRSSNVAASPGAVNSVFAGNAPPQIRQVSNTPQTPVAGQSTVITAKITDQDQVAGVVLHYQLVLPGNYIPAHLPVPYAQLFSNPIPERQLNPAFEAPANWTTIAMVDDGTGGDAIAHDNIFTATIPGQVNRTLVRYRITVTDTLGASVRAPYTDDPALNFAYYVYNGVPDYVATTSVLPQPGGAPTVHSAAQLSSVPVYSLIARASDITDAVAADPAIQIPQGTEARFLENWDAAFFYNGVVYDHVNFRLRGANGRYQTPPTNPAGVAGKRNWTIKFHDGHELEALDSHGDPYPTKWQTLNIERQFGNQLDGNWGLTEQVNNLLWNTVGVPAPYSHTFQFRVVDGVEEAPTGPTGQYEGDFWGIARAFENYDVNFLESHNLEKGNLYKLVNQTNVALEQERYLAPNAVRNGADHDNIQNNLRAIQDQAWLNAYVNYDEWYRYHAIAQAIKHYDYWPEANKNATWYFAPSDTSPYGQLWTLPFDTDATWGPTYNAGQDRPYDAIYAVTGGTPKLDMQAAYRNVIREVRDLIWQPNQIETLIRHLASFIDPLEEADRDRWKNAPASAGRQDFPGTAGETLEGKIQDMLKFAFQGGSWPGGNVGAGGRLVELDNIADGPDAGLLPQKPAVTYSGAANYPTDGLAFQTGAFVDPQGNGTFKAMQWRIAEVKPVANPSSIPLSDPFWRDYEPALEWTAAWQSPVLTAYNSQISIPGNNLEPGKIYRVRVRMQDSTDRWSHWSDPAEFTTTLATNTSQLQNYLRVSEIMYHAANPPAGSPFTDNDYDFIELQNIGPQTLTLSGAEFGTGVTFQFTTQTLAPGQTILLVANQTAFTERYGNGLNVAGQYAGRLDNAGEQLILSLPSGVIQDFTFDDAWYPTTDGSGYSLIINDATAPVASWSLGTSWHASPSVGGSPGSVATPATVVSRQVFYNNSKFDGGDAGASASDDAAIAADKQALLPGGIATVANYTSYSRGINGIMVDLAGRPGPLLAASDFQFRVGNDDDPSGWVLGPIPMSVTVRNGAGVGGSDRVTLVWPDGAIKKQWLQVTVLVTAATGLAQPHVFYFGNAVGESGDSASSAAVNSTDEIGARTHAKTFLDPATIGDLYDYDRDGFVNATDQILARSNSTSLATRLQLINLSSGLQAAALGSPVQPPTEESDVDDRIAAGLTAAKNAIAVAGVYPLVETVVQSAATVVPSDEPVTSSFASPRPAISEAFTGTHATELDFEDTLYDLIACELVDSRF